MQHQESVSVLIAPLDWGLGHATRCIPIIRELIAQGARVMVATAGPQKMLLSDEFPDLEILDLPGYAIRYQRGIFLKWGLFFKAPSILRQIRRENRWLADMVQHLKPDAVISDNRYGLYHPGVHSIFLTHQLAIRTGMGLLFDRIIMKWNYKLIRNFSECWVPDWPGEISLAGKLSHPSIKPPVPITYIGILSRLKPLTEKADQNTFLILLSGPEPQRTQLENHILPQLKRLSMKCTVVRGLAGKESTDFISADGVRLVNHLPAKELNILLNTSELILSRSGYSSIMDLVQSGRNAILIPTPGQTEQEYLGFHLQAMNWMLNFPQKNFDVKEAIQQFRSSQLTMPQMKEPVLGEVVEELLKHCIRNKRSALAFSRQVY